MSEIDDAEKTRISKSPPGANAGNAGEPSVWASDFTGRVLGGCRLEEKIGEGGMGVVYKAHHIALDVPVAVKIMMPYPGFDRDGARRFSREARAAARLRHENIVAVLNAGEEEGLNFIVMEYIAGKSLQKTINEQGALPVDRVLRISLEIVGALECALKNGIIHRDVKPDNILINKEGIAKLADLGLAKRIGADVALTQTGVTVGSPYYIAPEQATDLAKADHRADIYSLGCVMFHMITGRTPYSGSTVLEVVLKHIKDPVPDAADINPRLPRQLTSVIQRMMSKDPEKRFQDPAEVRTALAPLLDKQGAAKAAVRPFFRKGLIAIASGIALAAAVTMVIFIRPPHTSHVSDRVETAPGEKPLVNKQPVSAPAPKHAAPQARPRTSPAGSGPSSVAEAVNSGNVQKLRKLLDKGISPNAPDRTVSPLHAAVARRSLECVRALLERGANPSSRDPEGDTPLHKAIRMSDFEILSALLDFGSNPNIADHTGSTPLEIARDMGNREMERKLKEKGAN